MCDIFLEIDNIPVEIKVDWRNGETDKFSELVYDGKPMLISSTNQTITYQDKLYDFSVCPRLQAHYTNFFKAYTPKVGQPDARKIHEILFMIRDI